MLARFARSGSQSHPPPLKNPRSANAVSDGHNDSDTLTQQTRVRYARRARSSADVYSSGTKQLGPQLIATAHYSPPTAR